VTRTQKHSKIVKNTIWRTIVGTWTKRNFGKLLSYPALFGVVMIKLLEFFVLERIIFWYLHKPYSGWGEWIDILTLFLIMTPFIFINAKQKKKLQEAEDKYKVLAEDSLVGIYSYSDNQITYANNRFLDILGYTRQEIIGRDFQHLVVSEDLQIMKESIENSGSCKSSVMQIRGIKKDRSVIDIEIYGTITSSKGKSIIIGSLLDITEQKNHEKLLNEYAFYDLLTGLPNRRFLENRLMDLIKNHIPSAVLFMDLDGFKKINDSHGHDAGDNLLRIVANRLTNCIQTESTISRFAGDEFVILLPHADKESAIIAAERIIKEINTPITLGTKEIHISTSIGIAFFPEHGNDSRLLIRNADRFMYDAKLKGKNTYILEGSAVEQK
jgi:diguanylate cyclase (GGDEF)-like protein/PAS domain S-box-containing protein